MAPNPANPPPLETGPHPAVSLIIGFGVIVPGAMVVHILFEMLVQEHSTRSEPRRGGQFGLNPRAGRIPEKLYATALFM